MVLADRQLIFDVQPEAFLAIQSCCQTIQWNECEALKPSYLPGSFPWNHAKGRPFRHTARCEGPWPPVVITGMTPWSIVAWLRSRQAPTKFCIGSAVTQRQNFNDLASFIRNRPSIARNLRLIQRVRSNHFRNHRFQMDRWLPERRELGRWWKLLFNYTESTASRPTGHDVGWHGTSLYAFNRICEKQNLECGWAENIEKGKPASGIFYMNGPEAHCCLNYMSYNDVQGDGWLWGVLLQLDVDRKRFLEEKLPDQKAGLKRGCRQQIVTPKYCRLNAVYIHQVHISEVLCSDRHLQWWCEPGFLPMFEVTTSGNWEFVAKLAEMYKCRGAEL